MLCKLTVSGIKFVASRCRPGILVKRNYSEFPESFPSTKGVADGKYLVNAVLAHDTGTVLDILESGVDPNFRSEQVICDI